MQCLLIQRSSHTIRVVTSRALLSVIGKELAYTDVLWIGHRNEQQAGQRVPRLGVCLAGVRVAHMITLRGLRPPVGGAGPALPSGAAPGFLRRGV